MGHGFGQLHKLRGIITYRVSPFELKAFSGMISHGLPNMVRRIREEIFYVVPRKPHCTPQNVLIMNYFQHL
jgi:ubiquinol-cytochrome c reductase subunit 8